MFIKLFILSLATNLILTIGLSVYYFVDLTARETKQLTFISDSVTTTANNIREHQVGLINSGVIDFSALSKDQIHSAIPILNAINISSKLAMENGIEMKIASIFNRPSPRLKLPLDPSIIEKFKSHASESIINFDNEKNTFTYFSPITLTPDCLLCHGIPKGEIDISGNAKEGLAAGEIVGYFQLETPLDTFKQSVLTSFLDIIVISLILLIINSGILFFVLKNIQRPLKDLLRLISKAGKGDLIPEPFSSKKDEYGAISTKWYEFITQLNRLLQDTKVTSENSQSGGNILLGTAHEITQTGIQVNAGILELSGLLKELETETQRTNQTSSDLSDFLKQLQELIDAQAGNIVHASEMVERITTSIQSISSQSQNKIGFSQALENQANEGIGILRTTMAKIANTANSTQEINELTEVIQKIAAQTSILAMNAAIEASHAGEAGKGFAVVADEIRNLSDSASASAKRISQTVKSIHESTEETRGLSEETVSRFNDISLAISSVVQGLVDLNESTKTLLTSSKLILESNEKVLLHGETIKDGSYNVKNKTDGIILSTNRIQQVIETSRDHFSKIEFMVKSLNDMSSVIITLGSDTNIAMIKLQNALNKFKLGEEK